MIISGQKSNSSFFPTLVALIFAISFFGFVDDKYRGWDDTNQYQLIAKRWAQGIRPPLKEIEANTEGVGTDYSKTSPILTPFVWSLLVKPSTDWNGSLFRIRTLQATAVATCFLFLYFALGGGISGLLISSIFFVNGFFREIIMAPITEPQSLLLLILSYAFPLLTGLFFVGQGLTRSPVLLLHSAVLLKAPGRLKSLLIAALSATWAWLFFKDLVKGVNVPIRAFSYFTENLRQLSETSASTLFNHLLPHENGIFKVIWMTVVCFGLVWSIKKAYRKSHLLFLALSSYFCLLFSVIPQGFRYYLPAFLLLLLELRPQLTLAKWRRWLAIAFIAHLGFQHFEEWKWLKNHDESEAQSMGLVAARHWIKEENIQNIMMFKMRYCLNFFDVQCFAYPQNLNRDGLIQEIKNKKITYLVFSGTDWMKEEKEILPIIESLFNENHIELAKFERWFDKVRVVDLSGLNL